MNADRVPATQRWNGRQIGPGGTAARIVLGAAFVIAAVSVGVDWKEWVFGLLGLPMAVLFWLAVRGLDAEPLRLTGPLGHGANIVIAVALLSALTVPALLFYGASMLLAAWRGIGACEIFAVSNWIRRRDDQFGCPVFLPVDAAEAAAAKVDLYC